HFGNNLDVRLELLQSSQEDVTGVTAPCVVLVDDGQRLEVRLHLHQVDDLCHHFGRGVGFVTHDVLQLLLFQHGLRTAVPQDVQNLQVCCNGGDDAAVAAGNGGQHDLDAAVDQTAVVGQQTFAACAFVNDAGTYRYTTNTALGVDVFDENIGGFLARHPEYGGRTGQVGRDADVQLGGFLLSKGGGAAGCQRQSGGQSGKFFV